MIRINASSKMKQNGCAIRLVQRKFAQGVPIPPSINVAPPAPERKPDPPREEQRNVYHNGMSARSLLDIVALQNVHKHKQPMVLLERLREDEIPAAAAPRLPVKRRRLALKANKKNNSMCLRPREKPVHFTRKRKAKEVVKGPSKKRPCPSREDRSSTTEDDMPLLYLSSTKEKPAANVGNYEGGREAAHSPETARRAPGSYQPSDSDNESVWETSDVTLERGVGGLGLSIAGGETSGDVSITRIAENGAAKKDGRLQIGDILLQVNDITVENAPHAVAVDALQKAGNVVRLRVRRARRPRVVTLWRGARGLGLGIAGGADDAAGGGGVFVSHIAVGGAAHHDGRLRLGDKILAVRDEDGIETSLIGATHAQAVSALRSTGEHVTLVVLPAGSVPSAARTAPLYSTKTQATSCSTLHELLEEEPNEIPRCVRMVRLVRSGSRLGMDIVGGLGGEVDSASGVEEDACGVFVSGVSVGGAAYGMLHRGDRILSVDGRDLTRATHEQAAAALKQYSGAAVSIAAQYQPEQYERLRARIRAINAAAAASPHAHRHTTHVPVHPDLHAVYQR